MSVKITGTVELNKKLKKMANMQDVKDVVKLNTSEMQMKAQRKVAVDSGTLKRSLTIDFSDGGLTGKVSSNMEYAVYQELGTRFMSGTPYMRPSLREQEIKFKVDMQRLMK